MRNGKGINITSRAYYFLNDIDIINFDLNVTKIDKKLCKIFDIYYIRYITIKTLAIMRAFTINAAEVGE